MHGPPEIEFNILAMRADPPAPSLRALAERGIDWKRILEHAQIHGILQYVARGIAATSIEVPEPWRGIMDRQIAKNGARALFQYSESNRIIAALRDSGIRSLPYKGTSLSILLFGKANARASSDIDILIPASGLAAAREAIFALGYDIVDPSSLVPDDVLLARGKDISFVNKSTRIMVEVHWRALTAGRTCGFDTAFEQLETAESGLSPATTLLLIVHHGLASKWEALKWVADVHAFVRNVPIDWPQVAIRSRALGSERPLEIALLLAHALLDTPLPFTIKSAASRRVAQCYERALRTDRRINRMRDLWMQLQARERWIDRLRFIGMVSRRKPRDFTAAGIPLVNRILRLGKGSFSDKNAGLDESQKIAELQERASTNPSAQ